MTSIFVDFVCLSSNLDVVIGAVVGRLEVVVAMAIAKNHKHKLSYSLFFVMYNYGLKTIIKIKLKSGKLTTSNTGLIILQLELVTPTCTGNFCNTRIWRVRVCTLIPTTTVTATAAVYPSIRMLVGT